MQVFKIFRDIEWQALRDAGETLGAPIDLGDGYIHLSTAEQVAETLARHFAGVSGLILCAVETDDVGDALRWEPSRGGALFPHLYRALRLADVRWHAPLELAEGRHVLPDAVR